MSGMFNAFSCCTKTCDVNKDGVVNKKDFEEAIYVVSKDFKVYLAKAVELSKNLDVAEQNAIKYFLPRGNLYVVINEYACRFLVR